MSGGLLPAAMRGSHWDGAAHAADWYTTIAAMAGASVDASGPLPPDGVALFDAITNNATSPRTEVVLQIMSNSTDNLHELPSAAWCATAGKGDVALCTPPPSHSAHGRPVSMTPPPRPYPALVPCNDSDPQQRFELDVGAPGSICSVPDGERYVDRSCCTDWRRNDRRTSSPTFSADRPTSTQ